VTSISFREPFESFWDLIEVSAQSWYNVRTYYLVNPTFKISQNQSIMNSALRILGKAIPDDFCFFKKKSPWVPILIKLHNVP